jgi:hypothetical protein
MRIVTYTTVTPRLVYNNIVEYAERIEQRKRYDLRYA